MTSTKRKQIFALVHSTIAERATGLTARRVLHNLERVDWYTSSQKRLLKISRQIKH